jgi:hypothetical protein
MDVDFPAAHSMDTNWYAIDRDGRVAAFWSGESGAVPEQALNTASPLGRSTPGLFEYEHADRFERPWHYEGMILGREPGPRVSGPYIRRKVPAQPIHVDQLPPGVRMIVKAVRFELSFAEEQAIQPAEHSLCVSEQPEYLTLAGERRAFLRPKAGGEL